MKFTKFQNHRNTMLGRRCKEIDKMEADEDEQTYEQLLLDEPFSDEELTVNLISESSKSARDRLTIDKLIGIEDNVQKLKCITLESMQMMIKTFSRINK